MPSNENKPRHMGPGPRVAEKPKDLSATIKKLVIYLHNFIPFIAIALVLAALSSIFSIVGPNKLKDLTNIISDGLIVNKEDLVEITNHFSEIELNEEVISNIMTNDNIDANDKAKFQETMSLVDINNTGIKEIMYRLVQLPTSILNIILPDYTTKGVVISTNDQIETINTLIKLDDVNDVNKIYKAIDKMPKSIQKLVKPQIDINKICKIVIFLLTLYIISAIFNFFQSFIMAGVSNKFAKELRTKISAKINKLPLKYFDNHSFGDILSRVTNDVDTIGVSMYQSLGTLVGAITLFVGSIIMMFVTNYILAITAILSSIIGFILMFIILAKSQKYFTARQVELGKLNGHIEEIYSSHNVVKAYNGEKEAREKFDKLNKNVYECNRKSQFISGLMQPIMAFIGNFSYVAVCIVGAILVVNNSISFGVIVAFMIYIRLFTSPLSQIAQGMTQLQTTAASSERVFEFLEEEEMEDESNKTVYLDSSKVKGNIEFNHVKFSYNEDKEIIKDFNCKVKPGQKVAIVGPTGAGKTTMVNLLMKFYNINAGDIKIDNVSIHDLTRDNIHNLFVMVLQDTWLFNGTIRDNIKYNKENITDKEIWSALETVGVDHFVKSLPNGLDYILSDNDSISSGQKQLLTIARGMIENAPFLILDEATSSVDTRTEELVQQAMDKLTEGKTSFIIAHRLSTIKNADLILVMNEGNIIEQGSHDQLMKKKGFYSELYNSQFKK